MPIKFIMTIDTEEDDCWGNKYSESTKNLTYLPPIQEIFEKYEVKPVYLCTYGMINSEFASDTIIKWERESKAEIGAHLHPWMVPPHVELGEQNNIVFPSELDNEIFEEKLKTLTESIRSKINKSPISYRAGMYGLKSDHVKILEKLGYKFDCSVTPLTDWRPSYKRDTAPDFRYCPQKEYYLDYNSLEVEGQSSVMEIPVTILFYRKILNTSPFLKKTFFKYKNNLITRLINKIFKIDPYWLRFYPQNQLKGLKHIVKIAKKLNLKYLDMIIHSSEFMPGGSPYNKDEASIERLLKRFTGFFEFLKEENIKSTTFEEIAKEQK